MDLVAIAVHLIEVRDELKETAREIERKSRRLDRLIDDFVEQLKHRGLVESRRTSEKTAAEGVKEKETQK
jgi:hypothetical protein